MLFKINKSFKGLNKKHIHRDKNLRPLEQYQKTKHVPFLALTEITKKFNFLIDNVYIQVSDRVFQQCIGIPMETNCTPLLAELLLHDYKSTAMIHFSRGGTSPIPKSFSLTRPYINNLRYHNKPQFDKAIKKKKKKKKKKKLPIRTHPKNNLSEQRVAYLDHQLEIGKGRLVMSPHDKQDNFPFKVQNYPHLDRNVPFIPMCVVFINFFVAFVPVIDTRISSLTTNA